MSCCCRCSTCHGCRPGTTTVALTFPVSRPVSRANVSEMTLSLLAYHSCDKMRPKSTSAGGFVKCGGKDCLHVRFLVAVTGAGLKLVKCVCLLNSNV